MWNFNNKIKKTVSVFLAVLIFLSFTCASAQEDNTDGKEKSATVQAVVEHLSIHARYDDVTQSSLYKEGLLNLLEEHPELYEEIMKSILGSIDEHSEYYNTEETAALREDITGIIVGIGITFQMCADGVDVRSVIPDTPAANAGLKVGDIIVSADGHPLSGVNSDTAAGYIRGEKDTSLTIGVKTQGTSEIIYKDLVRDEIIGTSVESKIYEDGTKKLMYIRVYGFVSNTAECFREALNEAEKNNITNLIIDVRDNGGGLFNQVIEMADMLVPKGSLITTEDHKIRFFNVDYRAVLEDTCKFDIVVLVNGNSASASEVLAAALRENDCAVLIGEKTYGKGTIQNVADLSEGDSMKFTIGYYLTPKGNNINGIGITPDAIVQNTSSPVDMSGYPEFKYLNKYQLGDSGAEIKTAKELLKLWGLYSGEINEYYDKDLKYAVGVFQSSIGLYSYGVLDYTTQHELYTRISKSKIANDDQFDASLSHFGMTRVE